MASLTCSHAIGNVQNELIEKYYRLRANAGLIITEGTSPSANGLGYARIPGIFSDVQVQGWKRVNDGVHATGGRIFIQLMHTGRVSHPDNMVANTRIAEKRASPRASAVDREPNCAYAQNRPTIIPMWHTRA